MSVTAATTDIASAIREHFTQLVKQYGATPVGVGWANAEEQLRRYRCLLGPHLPAGTRVLDVGCGVAQLAAHLQRRDVACEYAGIDLCPDVIAAARAVTPSVCVSSGDVRDLPPTPVCDVAVCCGTFHVPRRVDATSWRTWVFEMLGHVFRLTTHRLAFNLLRVDTDAYHGCDPRDLFEYCRRNLSRFVTMRADYAADEYTIHVHRHVDGQLPCRDTPPNQDPGAAH